MSENKCAITVLVSDTITWKWCYQPRLNSADSHSCARALDVQNEEHTYEQPRQTLTESIESTCIENPPKLEILLADKLSTERCRRDDRAAKLVILFPVRSSLSRFMHSPMQPRSCIPAGGVINYSTCGDETLACQWILTLATQFQEQYGLQVKLPSSWLEQCRGYFVTICVWKGQRNKSRAEKQPLKQIWAHYTRVSPTKTQKAPSTVSSVCRSNPITHAIAYAFSLTTYLATCWASHLFIPWENNTFQLSSVL